MAFLILELSDADMAELDAVIARTETPEKTTPPTSKTEAPDKTTPPASSVSQIPPPKPESPRGLSAPPLKEEDILFKVSW